MSECRHMIKQRGDEDTVSQELRTRACARTDTHTYTHTHTHTHTDIIRRSRPAAYENVNNIDERT